MDAENISNSIEVSYRVARFNGKFYDYQDYNAKFDDIKQFCSWAQPDNFIARNYESFSVKDIQHYIKIKNRTFTSFCLPFILVFAAIIWVFAMVVLPSPVNIIVGVVLTLVAAFAVFSMFRSQKKKEKMRLYKKISTGWGVVIE